MFEQIKFRNGVRFSFSSFSFASTISLFSLFPPPLFFSLFKQRNRNCPSFSRISTLKSSIKKVLPPCPTPTNQTKIYTPLTYYCSQTGQRLCLFSFFFPYFVISCPYPTPDGPWISLVARSKNNGGFVHSFLFVCFS